VLDRLGLRGLDAVDGQPTELEREGARLVIRLDRHAEPAAEYEPVDAGEPGQLALFEVEELPVAPEPAPVLAPLVAVPAPPLHRVRRLSYSALSLFERCSYRYYAERVVGMTPDGAGSRVDAASELAATEVGDAVHALLERIDLAAPVAPSRDEVADAVRTRYPAASDDDVERIHAFVAAYCASELARRVARLPGAAAERPFAFEHDGVLLHGRLDVLYRDGGRALVVDYKTNSLAEASPEEIVEDEYRLQRLVYALACFRGGADEVEIVYSFLERPDAVVARVFGRDEVPELEAALSDAIARIQAGEFRPTPSEFTCAGCPALDVVCAGPRLREARPAAPRTLGASISTRDARLVV
jgi:PD-(D/E)XK nuclease superfamily